MKLRLSRLWPLGLFLAAALVAVCLLWPALPEALVLQGPDGYPDLSRPSLARRAAWWLAKGPSCLNHDELLRILLPPLAFHEVSYMVSAGLVALAMAAYLRALGLAPLPCCDTTRRLSASWRFTAADSKDACSLPTCTSTTSRCWTTPCGS